VIIEECIVITQQLERQAMLFHHDVLMFSNHCCNHGTIPYISPPGLTLRPASKGIGLTANGVRDIVVRNTVPAPDKVLPYRPNNCPNLLYNKNK